MDYSLLLDDSDPAMQRTKSMKELSIVGEGGDAAGGGVRCGVGAGDSGPRESEEKLDPK